jgi:hypothetical protein
MVVGGGGKAVLRLWQKVLIASHRVQCGDKKDALLLSNGLLLLLLLLLFYISSKLLLLLLVLLHLRQRRWGVLERVLLHLAAATSSPPTLVNDRGCHWSKR